MARIFIAGESYRWSSKHRRWRRARFRLAPAWFHDDPLTATLAYLVVISMIALGVLLILRLHGG